MSKVAIQGNASGTGTFTIAAPNSNTDRTLTLPDEAGTVLTGNSSLNAANLTGTLPAGMGGTFSSYAIVADYKALGTYGGTFTSGTWHTRDLNTEVYDPDGIVSLSSNQMVLPAGTYLVHWMAPAYMVGRHKTLFTNLTTGDFWNGSSEFATSNGYNSNHSWGWASFTTTATNNFVVQHRGEASGSSDSFGIASSMGGTGAYEVYTQVMIFKAG